MEPEIKNIKDRNKRVELDKAWETSWTRRSIVAAATYIAAFVWLVIIENEKPFLNALVPFGGYLFSTLSLPVVKSWWVNKNDRRSDEKQG